MLGWEADAAPQHPAKFRHHGCGDFDADLCFADAIFGQGCSQVEFDTSSSSSPFMVTLALMSFMLFSMILNLSVLKTVLYALHLQSVGLPGLAVR